MLFDLRGRGRRRTVQAIYLGLALLIGVGLVGFGVGGGAFSGGLFNAANNQNGSGGVTFADQVKRDQRLTRSQPNNPGAWSALAQDAFRQAGTGANYDSVTNGGQFTAQAQPLLTQASAAWQRYLALVPTPNPQLAREMLQVYSGAGALNQPAKTVQALEILISAQPSDGQLYASLAVAAYQAGNSRQGDLAAAKAVTLAPAAQQTTLRQQLAAYKANPRGSAATPGAAASPTPSSGSGTVAVPTPSPTTTTGSTTKR